MSGLESAGERPSLMALVRRMRRDSDQPSEEAIAKVSELIHTREEVDQTRCGIGSFKPKRLQVLARKEVFLVMYCAVAVAQGMFGTYNVAVASTLEKRFKLTSKQTGLIQSGNDISQIVLAIFLGYYGNFGHRPHWIGMGVLCASLASFLAALPHLVYGPGRDAINMVESLAVTPLHQVLNLTTDATDKNDKIELCHSRLEERCDGEDGDGESFLGAIIIIFVSQMVVGVSHSILWSIGVTYLDDNINKKTYPLYYAINLLVRMLGPVMGFMVGGKCLSLWIDPQYRPPLSMKDPRWLGAWWMGFLIIGCLLAVLGCIMLLFPRKLLGALRREAKRVVRQAQVEARKGQVRDKAREVKYYASLVKRKKATADKPSLRNLLKALRRIFTNKIWVANLFNTLMAVLAYGGYYTFKPKYIENQFRKSATEANYYTGATSVASLVIGTALGGMVMRWIRPRPRVVTGYNTFLTVFYTAGITSLIFIGCPELEIPGPYPGSPPVSECSQECGCSRQYSPMCSQDQTTVYYSPCYAGCTHVNTSTSPVTYSECLCMNSSTRSDFSIPVHSLNTAPPESDLGDEDGWWGVSGYCSESCHAFRYYLIAQIIIKSVWATGKVAASMIYLRAVRDEDKGIALGTAYVCVSFFGFIPSPIIMGAFIDSTCLVWDESCGKTGNCWLYDNEKIRLYQHLIPAIFNFLSLFGDFVVFYLSPSLDFYGDKQDEVNEDGAMEDEVEARKEERVEGREDGGGEDGEREPLR